MQQMTDFSTAMTVLASAAGCGLLMGIERERRKGDGPDRSLAGVRSFTLVSISGARPGCWATRRWWWWAPCWWWC